MAGKTRYKLEDRGLKLLIRTVPGKAGQIVRKVAFDVQAHWMTNMSSNTPSSPGQPPGIVTGNLKNSSSVGMRDEQTAEFRVGADYADDLEFGTMDMAPRPSIAPAIEAVSKNLPNEFKALVE
jgi:hypothetical protein